MNKSTYFCDHCYKEDHNDIKTFFNRYSKTDYVRHLKTKKHINNCLKIQKDDLSVTCKECFNLFSISGYEEHKKRNKSMWDMNPWTKKEYRWICNNFVVNGKRFGSCSHWSKWLDLEENKTKQKRKSKKSNNNNTITEVSLIKDSPPTYEESEGEKSDSEKEQEELVLSDYDERRGERPLFSENCDDCQLPQNDEGYSKDHLEAWNIIICNCDDEEMCVLSLRIKEI